MREPVVRRQSGFTLIELIVVLTVAAVLMGIGIPSFREFTATQKVKGAAFDFAAALLLARSEAVKRNATVTMTQTGGSWSNGWTVASGGTTLSTQGSLGTVDITPIDPSTTTAVSYQGNGRLDPATTLSFEFATAHTKQVRCLTIRSDGVPNTTSTSCPTP